MGIFKSFMHSTFLGVPPSVTSATRSPLYLYSKLYLVREEELFYYKATNYMRIYCYLAICHLSHDATVATGSQTDPVQKFNSYCYNSNLLNTVMSSTPIYSRADQPFRQMAARVNCKSG